MSIIGGGRKSPTEGTGNSSRNNDGRNNGVGGAIRMTDQDKNAAAVASKDSSNNIYKPMAFQNEQQRRQQRSSETKTTARLLLLLSLAAILAISLTGYYYRCRAPNNNNVLSPNPIAATTTNNEDAQVTSATTTYAAPGGGVQSNMKKYKNAARGVDGTVMKDMLRGYPLKTVLDEDLWHYNEEDSSDDDEEDSSDDEEKVEKKAVKRKGDEDYRREKTGRRKSSDISGDNDEDGESAKEESLQGEEIDDDEGEISLKETPAAAAAAAATTTITESKKEGNNNVDNGEDDNDDEDFFDVKAAAKKAKLVAKQISASNATATDIEKAAAAAKAVVELMTRKKDEKTHARAWESGHEAVMTITLLHGDEGEEKEGEVGMLTMLGGIKNKLLKGREGSKGDDYEEEDSSDDDDKDDDSSDDDDEGKTTKTTTNQAKPKKATATTATTTLTFPKTKARATNELQLPDLSTLSPNEAAHTILSSTNGISSNLQDRMSEMFAKAKTHECRAKIAEHFALFVNGLAMETKFPFQDWYYPNTCTAIPTYDDWSNLPPGVNLHDLLHRVYQPPRDKVPEGTYIENVNDLELVYVILTHDQPESTIRLIESVYVENKTKFVIHVDGKEQADDTYLRLVEYAQEKNGKQEGRGGEYIRLVPNDNRVRVNWGGFSMVNATLMAFKTLFGLDYYAEHPDEGEGGDVPPGHDNPHAFSFHKLIHLASTTYPLASNSEIRDTLASYPLDANFMHIILKPNDPTPQVWNYFVECDDAVHRIYRLPPLAADKGHGIDIYTSSQWFIISREFAWYLAKPPKNSLAEYYLEYIEHVVVADESFFGTVLRNTHFCSTLHNDNLLHIQFGSWENESKQGSERDPRKCIMRNPDHCGRSPTTMTLDYLPILELSGDLFARKFDDMAQPLVKDYIDKRRMKEEERFEMEEVLAKEIEANKTAGLEVTKKLPLEEWEFQGQGVLLVAKETVSDEVPLCLGLLKDGANKVHLLPCFKEDVPPTLSPDWYTGGVIIEEIHHYNRWDIGPCSSDGELKHNETTGELEMTPGDYSPTGPKCMIKIGDSIRKGRCLDVESERTKPGAFLNIYPCDAKWHQLFSFGNGDSVPSGSIHVSLPPNIAAKESNIHLCLGVQGRSESDEEEWVRPEHDDDPDGYWPWEMDNATDYYENGYKSLKYWDQIQLQTTPCSNEGAVIEFLYVPFIIEEYDNNEGESANNDEAAVIIEETAVEGFVGDEL